MTIHEEKKERKEKLMPIYATGMNVSLLSKYLNTAGRVVT
jgi:hypothetical protein